MSTPRIVAFENALDDLISEMVAPREIPEFATYFEETTIMQLIREALEGVDE